LEVIQARATRLFGSRSIFRCLAAGHGRCVRRLDNCQSKAVIFITMPSIAGKRMIQLDDPPWIMRSMLGGLNQLGHTLACALASTQHHDTASMDGRPALSSV